MLERGRAVIYSLSDMTPFVDGVCDCNRVRMLGRSREESRDW